MVRDDRAAQLRKGVLELAVLALLDADEAYAVELVERLGAHQGLSATAGTVYPLLARLDGSGLLRTSWRTAPAGPPRKYYRLTAQGRAALADGVLAWRDLTEAMRTVLGSPA